MVAAALSSAGDLCNEQFRSRCGRFLISSATGILLYEAARARAKRPIFDGREAITLYRVAYLTLYVLGSALGLAALVR